MYYLQLDAGYEVAIEFAKVDGVKIQKHEDSKHEFEIGFAAGRMRFRM